MSRSISTVVERFDEEVFNRHNLDVLDELVSESIVIHTFDSLIRGRDSWKLALSRLLRAFPDFHSKTEFTVSEDDKIAAWWAAKGTHRGDYQGIAATGRAVSICGVTIFRVVEGRIVEMWRQPDTLGLMRQIGAVPE
jgi:steroid delta-isomerase-like uncharacterized protein